MSNSHEESAVKISALGGVIRENAPVIDVNANAPPSSAKSIDI